MPLPPGSSDAVSESDNRNNTSIARKRDILAEIDKFLEGYTMDGEEISENNDSDSVDVLNSFDNFTGNIQNELSASANLIVNESTSKEQSKDLTFVGEFPAVFEFLENDEDSAVYEHSSDECNGNFFYKTLPPVEHIMKQEFKTENVDDESTSTDGTNTNKVENFTFSLDSFEDKTINTEIRSLESYSQNNCSKSKSNPPQYRNWNYWNNYKRQPGLLNQWSPYTKFQNMYPNEHLQVRTFTSKPRELYSSNPCIQPRANSQFKRVKYNQFGGPRRMSFTRNNALNNSLTKMNNIRSNFNYNFMSRPSRPHFPPSSVPPLSTNKLSQKGSFIRPQHSSNLPTSKPIQNSVNTHSMWQKHLQHSDSEHVNSPVPLLKPDTSIELNRIDIKMQKFDVNNHEKVSFQFQILNDVQKYFLSPVSLNGTTITFKPKKMASTNVREAIIKELSSYGTLKNSWWSPDDVFYASFTSNDAATNVFNICTANSKRCK